MACCHGNNWSSPTRVVEALCDFVSPGPEMLFTCKEGLLPAVSKISLAMVLIETSLTLHNS